MRKMNATIARDIETLTNDYLCIFDELIFDEFDIYNMNDENVIMRNRHDINDIHILSIARMKQCMNYVALLKTYFDKLNMFFECVDENDELNKFNVHAIDKTTCEYVNARVVIDERNVCSII